MKPLEEMIYDAGFLPILIVGSEDCAERVVHAVEQTDIPTVEILQRSECAFSVLKEAIGLRKNALIGAGTVLTLEQCKRLVDAGADYIVSPGFRDEIVEWCVKQNVPVIPGVSTPTEILKASSMGIRIAKFFPFYEEGGIRRLEAMSQPFPDLTYILTGFIDDRELGLLSHKKVAGIGGVWMFQSEEDSTVIPEEAIVERIEQTLVLSRHYRRGWVN